MQYPYFENAQFFQPSPKSLNMWLRTRKNSSIGHSSKPGFFQTIQFPQDQSFAIISIVIEFIALVATLYGGFAVYEKNQNFGYLIGSGLVVFVFVAFDFIGVKLHSSERTWRTELKSEIPLLSPILVTPALKKLNAISNKEFSAIMLLAISGILKILALLLLYNTSTSSQTPSPILIIGIVLYLFVIYSHIYHTGYWLSAVATGRSIKKDYEDWVANQRVQGGNPEPAETWIQNFSSTVDIGTGSLSYGRIMLKKSGEIQNTIQYILTCSGILLDEDLSYLYGQLPNNFIPDFSRAIIRMQRNQALLPPV
jgi:hypothetical protein